MGNCCPALLWACAALQALALQSGAAPALLISEFLANPGGSLDSPREFVELLATESIDFSRTPYCVVFTSNGKADERGWAAGGGKTYGFNISSGAVVRGSVVYVGGSNMNVGGVMVGTSTTRLRAIDTGNNDGDCFGSKNLGGVLGNGGLDADGIAVFATDIYYLTGSSVPVDAIFYGMGVGCARYNETLPDAGTAGYQLPVNDSYAGGKLQNTSYLIPISPSGDQVVTAAGVFHLNQQSFTTPRTWRGDLLHSEGSSIITLVYNPLAPSISTVPDFCGAVGDPGNPDVTFVVNPAAAVVSVLSGNPNVVPNASITLTPTGLPGQYTLGIVPMAVGYALLTITAASGTNLAKVSFQYAASGAANPGTRFHTFASDASTALAISATHMLAGDDEDQVLRIYDRTQSGPPLKTFPMNSVLNLKGDAYDYCTPREVDLEASTRLGNRLFWLASLGNSPAGELRTNRNRLFATDLSGTNLATYSLNYVGRYEHLREDLIDWDHRGLHGEGADHYGLAESAGIGKSPDSIDGFNVEGLAMSPDGQKAYIGFRSPYVPPSNRTKALVVPLLNLPALVAGSPAQGPNPDGSGLATFGRPMQIDLGGRGVRSMEGNGSGMLIIAGPADDTPDFRLFTWTGNAPDAPQERLADLTGMRPEGIVELPEGPLTDNSVIQLVSDNGTVVWYGDGVLAKNVPDPLTKFRSDRVTLGPAIPRMTCANYLIGHSFSFSILGRDGSQYTIESSDNGLASWTIRATVEISTGMGGAGTAQWSDSNLAPSGKARFYRATDSSSLR